MLRESQTRQYWLAHISILSREDQLEKNIIPFAQDWSQLPDEDVKAICYALLSPRFQPTGATFIAENMMMFRDEETQRFFNDQKFTDAFIYARSNKLPELLQALQLSGHQAQLTERDRACAASAHSSHASRVVRPSREAIGPRARAIAESLSPPTADPTDTKGNDSKGR